jgi:hypothetical protein
MSAPDTEPVKTAPAQDSGLRCPRCDYNLTGLPENICPECGAAFDPEELRRRLPEHIPGWERPGVSAFFSVCMMTWGQPVRFARQFPVHYRADTAASFRRYALGLTLVILVPTQMAILVRDGLPLFVISFTLTSALVLACVFCEFMLWGLLDIHYPQRDNLAEPAAEDGPSWAGLIGFYRSFLPMTAAAVAGLVLTNAPLPAWGLLVGVVLWWGLALLASILVRMKPPVSAERVGGILAILLLPLLVSVAGMALTALLLIGIIEYAVG